MAVSPWQVNFISEITDFPQQPQSHSAHRAAGTAMPTAQLEKFFN
jgi:hypothetical protein